MCTSCSTISAAAPDQKAVDQFTEELLRTLNHAGLALMISIGHRTKLFDVMASLPPSSSIAIAGAAHLNERYVREWLGAMVTGGIVRFDATKKTYHLPAEHAARLTRAAYPTNMASMMQWLSILGGVENDIVRCFSEGGGVPYERFNRFHEAMAEESNQTTLSALTQSILPLAPEKMAAIERGGARVLDIGCGKGRAMIHLAERYPASQFFGYDFSREAIESARAEAQARGLSNIRFEVRDVSKLDDKESFDVITAFDAIHDQMKPAEVLRNIQAALKPDGVFLMQDIRASSHVEKNIGSPIAPFLYTISTMHCMTVSLAGGGAGLGTCWGQELALSMLGEAGFSNVKVHQLEHDIQNDYYVARK